ncbi:helix-turn-helix transcriptional regulator [Demequina sp.]|uniref:helix-turn-helix transcriptional regulator n=1 Tax=Demequina sp. TaxID=2050685 RepID=UPI003A841E05
MTWLRTSDDVLAFIGAAQVESGRIPTLAIVDRHLFRFDSEEWSALRQTVHDVPGLTLVVRSFDSPGAAADPGSLVLTERDFALSQAEIAELAELNAASAPPGLIETLAVRYRGNPSIVRQRLDHQRRGTSVGTWTSGDAALEAVLAARLWPQLESAIPEHRDSSTMLATLERAIALRYFDPLLLETDPAHASDTREHFARITALPFGATDADVSTSETNYVWSEPVWAFVRRMSEPATCEARARLAVDAARKAHNVFLELYALVDLGELAAADQLAYVNFRAFADHAPAVVERAVNEAVTATSESVPSLTLLGAIYADRHGVLRAISVERATRALTGLAGIRPADDVDALRVAVRQAVAHVVRGDRQSAVQCLVLVEGLFTSTSPTGVLARAARDPLIAACLPGEALLAMRSATQVDNHTLPLMFSDIMLRFANPSSPTAGADNQFAATPRVFAGRVDEVSDIVPGASPTDPLLALEVGDDVAALDMLRYANANSSQPLTHSALDGFSIALRSLLEPESVTSIMRDEVLAMSAQYWIDGVPSTVVIAGVAVATTVAGSPREALALCRRYDVQDWFTWAAEGIALLSLERPDEAVPVISAVERTSENTRAAAIAGVLAASAQWSLGHTDATIQLLERVLRESGARVLRMALRFAIDDHVTHWTQLDTSPALSAALATAEPDRRTLRCWPAPTLTTIELELLAFMRQGLTYRAIAEYRFVSINTVRSQVKTLLTKLDVSSRAEAVATAEELGLFAQDRRHSAPTNNRPYAQHPSDPSDPSPRYPSASTDRTVR